MRPLSHLTFHDLENEGRKSENDNSAMEKDHLLTPFIIASVIKDSNIIYK